MHLSSKLSLSHQRHQQFTLLLLVVIVSPFLVNLQMIMIAAGLARFSASIPSTCCTWDGKTLRSRWSLQIELIVMRVQATWGRIKTIINLVLDWSFQPGRDHLLLLGLRNIYRITRKSFLSCCKLRLEEEEKKMVTAAVDQKGVSKKSLVKISWCGVANEAAHNWSITEQQRARKQQQHRGKKDCARSACCQLCLGFRGIHFTLELWSVSKTRSVVTLGTHLTGDPIILSTWEFVLNKLI